MKSRIIFFVVLAFVLAVNVTKAQVSGTITVNGDLEKYYPVIFLDGANGNNIATELEIGRSSVHRDSAWRGSIIAKFRYHVYNWGNGSNFIDADIRQSNINNPTYNKLIAGWQDLTTTNSESKILIWLRGNTTYSYVANMTVSPAVYDGVQHPLPYQQTGGPTFTFKTTIDAYVNTYGMSYANTAYFNGTGNNYFAGNVGINALDTKGYRLAVGGSMIAEKVKVELQTAWPDYVFEQNYQLPSLMDVEKYIHEHKHLPDVPSAAIVEKEGQDLGEMSKMLLQKIEELTLYLIDLKKENSEMKQQHSELLERVDKLEKK